jgi:hypothetical protein
MDNFVIKIARYTAEHQADWDTFVSNSRNGSFLFYRDYMGYHQDRFPDHSLLCYDDHENLIALFPANEREQRLDSHGGLTYGGFVTDERMKVARMLGCFEALVGYARDSGFQEIRYKSIPHIYHRIPAQEDLYALHLLQATCISRGLITGIDMRQPVEFQTRRVRQLKSARKNGLVVQHSADLATYWDILSQLLRTIHDTQPVHSLTEIQHLHGLFPENIKLFASYRGTEMLAGVLVYESQQVARTQYIAANAEGRDLGALDLIFDFLIHEQYQHKPYIEFGTSERQNSFNRLNAGLIDQKEGFGARAVIQDQYLIQLDTVCIEALKQVYS